MLYLHFVDLDPPPLNPLARRFMGVHGLFEGVLLSYQWCTLPGPTMQPTETRGGLCGRGLFGVVELTQSRPLSELWAMS